MSATFAQVSEEEADTLTVTVPVREGVACCGAGKLMQLLLGIHYKVSVIVGAMIVVYVTFGGMKATYSDSFLRVA